MKKTLVLVGSGEFTPAMEDVDRELLSKASNKTVAILPTSAGQEDDFEKWIAAGITHFVRLGAKPVGIPLVKRKDTENTEYLAQLAKSSFIYFSGGEPSYLYSVLVDTPAWKTILARYKDGAILAGSSAGAVAMGSYVLQNAQEIFYKRTGQVVWQNAFGLVPYLVSPHYDWALKERSDVIARILKDAPKDAVAKQLGIDEDTALIVENEAIGMVSGKGTVHQIVAGNERVYRIGETVRL